MLAGCVNLPSLDERSTSTVLADTASTTLGRAIAPVAELHPGKSGVYPLVEGADAFAARILLTRVAERTLDVQYYIWRPDLTGMLLFNALIEAAERGVRVRLLLDDNNTVGLDPVLAALDAHPNIEVRLFNPFVIRCCRWIGYLTDFSRLNRRMHNKSFTADNQSTIIGGRNVGDEYFEAGNDVLFADLDVLAIGPVVNAVSTDFDRYWASHSSYPLRGLLPPSGDPDATGLKSAAKEMGSRPAAQRYFQALRENRLARQLVQGDLEWDWAPARLVSDHPAKGLGGLPETELVTSELKEAIGDPEEAVELVSPYFVPTAHGVAEFAHLARRGVRVRVLTNALEATDVPAVHSGYAKRRKALLEAGVTLYEMKRSVQMPSQQQRSRRGLESSSASSLHAKTISVDRTRVFIGSFNFDPRSAKLNTEMGFVIESPSLARRVESVFDDRVPLVAYEARLSADGHVYWLERTDSAVLRYETEPGTTYWQRFSVFLISLLPIDWLL